MIKASFYQSVEDWILHSLEDHSRPLMVGLSGPQGCGKTTLAQFLVESFKERDLKAVSISIDDFYLTREEQAKLTSNTENPYLKQRGYPGTHDVDLGTQVLSDLKASKDVTIPQYDKSLQKGKGDRLPKSEWPKISEQQDIVILDGWMLGFKALDSVSVPYFKEINDQLKKYEDWLDKIDVFCYLKPQEVNDVINWRVEAEQKMRQSGKESMTDQEVLNYVEKFIPAYRMYSSTIPKRQSQFESYKEILIGKDREAFSL